MAVRLTHIGGPTVLIEAHGWRLLVDPTFDPPGDRYGFGWGTSSTKLVGPALGPADVGEVDAVLLSHDHHADNLDTAGRRFLDRAPTVVTTRPGQRRLGHPQAVGLRPWQSHTLRAADRPALTVTATPCRHGPPLSRPISGAVIGFALDWESQPTVWVSGDSVLYRGLRQVAERHDVDVAVLHLGAVAFPITGPLRYSMDAQDAVELTQLLQPRVAVPVHCEGWSHFSEQVDAVRARLSASPLRDNFRFVDPGIPATL